MDWAPLDILYITLAICVTLLTIFICVALYNAINILRDVSKVVDKTEKTVDKVNRIIIQPLRVAASISEGLERLIVVLQHRFMDKESDSKK